MAKIGEIAHSLPSS